MGISADYRNIHLLSSQRLGPAVFYPGLSRGFFLLPSESRKLNVILVIKV